MYKLASQLKLRIPTGVGLLSAEQLWDLSQSQLSEAIKSANKALKKDNDDELSFLENTDGVNTLNQLRFDILKDVYLTKKQASEDHRDELDKKAFNQKIDDLIAEKRDGKLREMSIEDLECLRK